MHLQGKIALITGGTSGLGLEIARKLLEKNAIVYACGKSQLSLDQANKEINHPNYHATICDITHLKELSHFVNSLPDLDILLNVAGIWLEGDLESNNSEDIKRVIDVNLTGLILVTKFVLPILRNKQETTFIINVASTLGTRVKLNESVYIASKWGVRGFTDALKMDLLNTNIRVVGFYPGGMRTQFFAKAGYPRNNTNWLDPAEVADSIIHILTRSDSMWIDHIVINKRL